MKKCDGGLATEGTGVSSEIAQMEIGVLSRWFCIRTKSK